ncbi:DUF916 domain-containing protein [Holzapfeliella floricola]|uniref:DUF916 domain-containing protein n=1 Tax=Holzapfeliella floricola TaxID=679249 RepID=UPI001A922679|nr:DUF916 domain-containing protein [Holzapfeliella floricola]
MSFLSITHNNQTVFATSQIPFQLQAIHPDNQLNANDYDDLLITPNTSQDLSFVVQNSDNSARTFVVEANNATTSDGIAVTYDEHERNNLLSPMFSDLIANRKQKITVPANTSQTVTFNLKYPSQQFDGVILGGITVI